MPASVQVTYPGVYVQEIPSGNITITGVATSITAFVGRTVMGPSAVPIDCFSYADFERFFGGRAYGYPLGYAVEDFFQNGGSHAVIVRAFVAAGKEKDKAGDMKAPAAVTGPAPSHAPELTHAPDAARADSTHAADAAHSADVVHADAPDHTAQDKAADPALAAPPPAKSTDDGKQVPAATAPVDGIATATAGGLMLVAASPGSWANGTLSMKIDVPAVTQAHQDGGKSSAGGDASKEAGKDANKDLAPAQPQKRSLVDMAAEPFKRFQLQPSDLFNLTLTYVAPDGRQVSERFANVAIKGTAAPNRLDRVLAAQSQLARVRQLPTATPTAVDNVKFGGGSDSADLGAGDLLGDPLQRTGVYALDNVDIFNLLCIPPDPPDANYADIETLYQGAAVYCQKRRAMLILDPPREWSARVVSGQISQIQPTDLDISGPALESRNCAVYFPRIRKLDPETGQIEVFPACGAIAGVYAATDSSRGVWKAPAGITAGVGGISGLEFNLTDDQNGQLNPLGINCLRSFPIIGPVVWGARTLRGADVLSDDYKYVPVRRLTLFIEESLYRGTKFAVFEPNDETLWSQLRLSIGAFMADLARQGAFYGYVVACDKTTTTQYDIDRGIVNVRVAFAPVKPAEFIVLQIQQQAGQTAS